MVADLTDLSVYSAVFGMSVSPLQYVHRGKALCRPRDLVSQPLVVVGVVKERYVHWRLGGRELRGSGKKGGKHCARDLRVTDLCQSQSFPCRVPSSNSKTSRGAPCRMSSVYISLAAGGRWLKLIVNAVASRSVGSTTPGYPLRTRRTWLHVRWLVFADNR